MSGPQDPVDGAVRATRALVGIAVRSLSAALEVMTLPQYRVLVLVATRGPQRSGDLAVELGVHPSTLTRTVDRLVGGGWVRRTSNPANRREVLVEATGTGRELVEDVTAHRRREVATVLERLAPDERARVGEGLALFAGAAGDPGAGELSRLGVER
ncbi:MarR family transcriptional regulator [Paenibacillus sp. TRM 82003]|uniref:MarR family transcriptional regulator n=1 Tax=Kineococcus sp. TRM81007 TaxID=2925831 RepID=UPI001F58C9B1|nr:MarR family transcriptional regulator [Kineococcus sp. TRM81007]MCI2237567.1 MarR family transcriptional regulator [Kineococcus sp. TRM81007]MCI3921861.1 MarR family transcriptional regulator [Paenibacillus sp. TRM 82003]